MLNNYEPSVEELKEFIRLPIQVQVLKMANDIVQMFGQFAIDDHKRIHNCFGIQCYELHELFRKLNKSAEIYAQVIKEIQEIN